MKNQKMIEFNTPKGVYTFPLIVVAKHRVDYYRHIDGDDFNEQAEIDYVMDDDYEGIDWLMNNMDFEDIPTTELVKVSDDVNVTDDDFWTDSDDFEIV